MPTRKRSPTEVWAATDHGLVAFDPGNGEIARRIDRASDAGTAFDGKYLYQIAEARIDKIDPATGEVVASIPAPGQGRDSGMAWAEGSLWVGQYRDRKILQIDPVAEPDRARRSYDSHLARARWISQSGHRQLLNDPKLREP